MGRGIGGGAKGCGGVCIREQECLGLYMENGTVHYVPLPFEACTSVGAIVLGFNVMVTGEGGVASGCRADSGTSDRS